MNKASLVEHVTAQVKAGNVDEHKLAIELMNEGASMPLVNRELSKALIALGVKEDPSVERKAIDKAVKAAKLDKLSDHDAVITLCNKIADKVGCDAEPVLKAIRKAAKKADVALPGKPKLGVVKNAIIAYFANNKKDRSIAGLAKYLTKTVEAGDKDAEKHAADMLRTARMNFTFCVELLAA